MKVADLFNSRSVSKELNQMDIHSCLCGSGCGSGGVFVIDVPLLFQSSLPTLRQWTDRLDMDQ